VIVNTAAPERYRSTVHTEIWGEGSVNRLGNGSPTFRSFEILVSFAAALPTIL
jgi:hypothetical protein